jgi:hypothetical protein
LRFKKYGALYRDLCRSAAQDLRGGEWMETGIVPTPTEENGMIIICDATVTTGKYVFADWAMSIHTPDRKY